MGANMKVLYFALVFGNAISANVANPLQKYLSNEMRKRSARVKRSYGAADSPDYFDNQVVDYKKRDYDYYGFNYDFKKRNSPIIEYEPQKRNHETGELRSRSGMHEKRTLSLFDY